MRPAPFGYAEPESVEAACGLLTRHGGDAAVLAGGQSLMAQLNARERRVRLVVAIRGIPGLHTVTSGPEGQTIGAGVTQRAVHQHAATPVVLAEALARVGHVPTRNRGTVGGSIAFGDPQGELPTVALALGARVRLTSERGERTLAVRDLYTGPFATAIAPDELLTAVEIPAPAGIWAFEQRDFRRHGRTTAVAGIDGSRVVLALGGVGSRPFLVDDAVLAPLADGGRAAVTGVADAVRDLVVPIDDFYTSTDYRRQLAATAVTAALHRVLAGTPTTTEAA